MPGGSDAVVPHIGEGDISAQEAERYLGKQLPLLVSFGTNAH